MALMAEASIWVLRRSTEARCMRPSLVLVSMSRGMESSALGDDFFCRDRIFQSSIQNSMFCKATNVRLVARNWATDRRFGTAVVVFRGAGTGAGAPGAGAAGGGGGRGDR